jgi:hypothetical protein
MVTDATSERVTKNISIIITKAANGTVQPTGGTAPHRKLTEKIRIDPNRAISS